MSSPWVGIMDTSANIWEEYLHNTLCKTTHQSTKFTNRSNYLHHPHRYQPMPILKFSIFIIPAQVKQREKKRKGGNNVEERRETWRIAFAFSKMAANLKFVLGP